MTVRTGPWQCGRLLKYFRTNVVGVCLHVYMRSVTHTFIHRLLYHILLLLLLWVQVLLRLFLVLLFLFLLLENPPMNR